MSTVNLKQVMYQVDGKTPFKVLDNGVDGEDKERDLTIRDVCLQLLNGNDPELQYQPGKDGQLDKISLEKERKYALIKKIREAGDSVNITNKDGAMISRLAAMFQPDADRYGQTCQALEGDLEAASEANKGKNGKKKD